MLKTEREGFLKAWASIAPGFYFDAQAPMPAADPKNDMWMIKLAWKIWQRRAKGSRDA